MSLAIPGRHSVSNALAAAACAVAAGASIEQIVTGLEAATVSGPPLAGLKP